MEFESLEKLANNIKKGRLSSFDLVNQCLSKIEDSKEYNAIISLVDGAKEKAKEADKNVIKAKGRLHGIPFIAKDNFLAYGADTTAASNILKGFKAPYQATAVERLEAEGAILIAKANLDAFGHGGSTENSDYGPTKNPRNKSKVAGGSSGGPAAAVAHGLTPFAIGTDTGGSNRQPASFCGVVGYKPTYGLVSRWGVIAMTSSTDTIGPITRTVEDSALVLDVLAGKDGRDSTMIDREDSYLLNRNQEPGTSNPLKIGVIKEFFGEGIDEGVKSSTEDAIEKLISQGAEAEEVNLPLIEKALAAYYIIVPAEISSNLARYDGVKFGLSKSNVNNLQQLYEETRSEGFGAEAKRRIMMGAYVLSSGYYDAYYKKAQQIRTLIIDEFNKAFEQYDVLVGPVAPTTAFKLGENTDDPLKMYLADIMTVGPSLAGLPAISVPVKEAGGMPVGLQIIGAQGQDRKVLEVAKQVESANG